MLVMGLVTFPHAASRKPTILRAIDSATLAFGHVTSSIAYSIGAPPPAGWRPFGLGETKPHHFLEIFRTMWENKRAPVFAWRILRDGVCDGCALGTTGMRDFTMDGVHLCTVRLNMLRLNTMDALDTALLADVSQLKSKSSKE